MVWGTPQGGEGGGEPAAGRIVRHGHSRESPQVDASKGRFPETKASEAQVLEFLRARDAVGLRDLREAFGLSYQGARNRLWRLRAKGLVEPVERGVWRLRASGGASGDASGHASGTAPRAPQGASGPAPSVASGPPQGASGGSSGAVQGQKGGAVAEPEKEKPSPGGDLKAEFAALLQRYKVRADTAAMVADHIVHTQPDDVLESPEKLAEALGEFPVEIPALKRRQVLKAWFARRGVEVPEAVLRAAGATAEAAEAERPARLYAVDEETGRIRAAREGEKALTWAEAKTLSDEIKRERAKEEVAPEAAEPPFIPTEEGGWTLNPKAKFGVAEVLAWQALRRSEERGEPQDPYKILAEQAATAKMLREAFGGGERRETALDLIQMLGSLNLLRGPGGGGGAGARVAGAKQSGEAVGQEAVGGAPGDLPAPLPVRELLRGEEPADSPAGGVGAPLDLEPGPRAIVRLVAGPLPGCPA